MTRLDQDLEYVLNQINIQSEQLEWVLRQMNRMIARAKKLEDLAEAINGVVKQNPESPDD